MEGNWPLWPTKPMLARISAAPFSHPEWVFEVKWDGIRCLMHLSGGTIRLQARSLRDISKSYPELLDAHRFFDAESAVIDGEIVALDPSGKPSFNLLQNRMNLQSDSEIAKIAASLPVTYYAFDLLHCNGRDLMHETLEARKSLLRKILTESSRVKFSDHVERDGREFFSAAERMGVEGVVAKRKDSAYEPGVRSAFWLKVRVVVRDDFVIGGWTPGRGGRSRSFGALLLGQYANGRLHYVGKVGTGFDSRLLLELLGRLRGLESQERPFVEDPREPGARWTRPELVCEVKLSGRTPDALRFPVFIGLRPDKNPVEVTFPEDDGSVQEPGRLTKFGRVSLSNPDKIMWPSQRYTKSDLFTYYVTVAKHILPYLRDRPLTLHRQPDGIEGESFFQRNRPAFTPGWIRSTKVIGEGHAPIDSILCQNTETLAWLANLACIELHPWMSKADDPNKPDFIIFDLDPVHPARYGDACAIAIALFDLLGEVGFRTYVKTSGKRGLHIYMPIKRELTYEQARSFASEVGRHLVPKFPRSFTMNRRAEEKKGKVFFDPSQLGWGRSLASPYSLRPTAKATVSTPITWEECESCVGPELFDIRTVPDRLHRIGDPWRRIMRDAQPIGDVLESKGAG